MNFAISWAASVPRSWPITIKPFPVTDRDFALSWVLISGFTCNPLNQLFESVESSGSSN